MNDVNLKSPDLKLFRTSEQAPARASASPQDQSGQMLAQATHSSENRSMASGSGPNRAVNAGEQVDRAVSQLNDYVQNVQRDLQFEVDNELGQTIVKVVDQETKKVIRQIPDEVALRLAEKLLQDEPLTLFDLKV